MEPTNSRIPTASFNRGNDTAKATDRRFAAPVPVVTQGQNYHDLFCPFGFEGEISLRLSQKKLKRKTQEEKVQRRKLQLAINSDL